MKRYNLSATKSVTYALSILLIAACTSSKSPSNEFSKYGFMEGIYSTRPQSSEPSITMLKLKNPALLETAERKAGVLTIDKDLAQAIQDEQAATIADLQKISPEIKVLLRYRLVLNALTIMAPADVLDKVRALPNVVMSERSSHFSRPQPLDVEKQAGLVGKNTSVK